MIELSHVEFTDVVVVILFDFSVLKMPFYVQIKSVTDFADQIPIFQPSIHRSLCLISC